MYSTGAQSECIANSETHDDAIVQRLVRDMVSTLIHHDDIIDVELYCNIP